MYSQLIYDQIRSMNPPGRFLKQDPTTKLWSSIGKKKSIDKTRQALREGAPELLKGLEAWKEDQEDIISATCMSRADENAGDYAYSLEDDKNSSLFEWNQSQNISGDASLESMMFPGPNMQKHSATTEVWINAKWTWHNFQVHFKVRDGWAHTKPWRGECLE